MDSVVNRMCIFFMRRVFVGWVEKKKSNLRLVVTSRPLKKNIPFRQLVTFLVWKRGESTEVP